VAYSRLSEFCSTLILLLLVLCVSNIPTLVLTLRIGWFIKPFTDQTIFQRTQPLGCFVEVFSRSPTNIWCHCLIVVFDPRASVPFVKLFLSHTAFLIITMTYSCLIESYSTFILNLPLVCLCVFNTPTLVSLTNTFSDGSSP